MSEPFATVAGRTRLRKKLIGDLTRQIADLARSFPHRHDVATLQPIPSVLAQIEKREIGLLASTVKRVLSVGTMIATDHDIFQEATYYQDLYGLALQDAIVYASVVIQLRRESRAQQHIFVNKNWRDFEDPGIIAELGGLNCLLIRSFDDGLRFVLESLGPIELR